MTSNVLCDLLFSQNQLLNLADDENIGILKNETCNLGCLRCNKKKKQICDLLGYYAAYSGNPLPTFRDNEFMIESRISLFSNYTSSKFKLMTARTTLLPSKHSEERSNKCSDIPACAILTTSEWDASRTFTLLMLMIMSPTSSPDVSAGVSGSIADTTTGREPCIRNPNSPDCRLTTTVLSHSETPRTCNPYSTQQHQTNNSTEQNLSWETTRPSGSQEILLIYATVVRRDSVVGIAIRSGDRIPVEARFSVPIQTVAEAHPAFYTTRNGSLPWGQSGQGVLLITHRYLTPRLKKE